MKSRYFLHLAALSSFALAQPLFAKLGPAPGYFAAHGLTSLEVVLLAVALVALPPLVLFIPELIVGRRLRWVVHLLLVAALVALVALPPLGVLSTSLAYGLAALIGISFAVAYARSRGVREFTSMLALAPLLFLGWLLFVSPTADFVAGAERYMLDSVARTARSAIEAGQLRADLDVEQFAYQLFSLILGAHHLRRLLRDPRAEAHARAGFQQLLDSARPSP